MFYIVTPVTENQNATDGFLAVARFVRVILGQPYHATASRRAGCVGWSMSGNVVRIDFL